jgi:biotin carboxyl carrier protein
LEDVWPVENIAAMRYVTTVEGRSFTVEVQKDQVIVDGQAHNTDLRRIEPLSLYSLLVGNRSHELLIERQHVGDRPPTQGYGVMLQGKLYAVRVQQERTRNQATSGSFLPTTTGQTVIEAPMPGLVLKMLADVGHAKRAGEVLIVLESMKMQIELRCPQDSVIQAVYVAAHDHVTQGQALVTLEQG